MKTFLFIILTFLLTTSVFSQVHNSDTLVIINKQTFKIQTRDIPNDKLQLNIFRNTKLIMTDTIYGGLNGLDFPDINKDGNNDLLLPYIGNNFTFFLYLFDGVNNCFKKLEGFERFPEAVQLKSHSELYYSYHRAGCADLDWVSDLFRIENFKTIHIGHIYGMSCEDRPQVIEIYKVKDNNEQNETLVDKLSYLKNIPNFEDKWEFIETYWNKNYAKFN